MGGAVLPIVTSVLGGIGVGQTLFPGFLGGNTEASAEAPVLQETSTVLDDELASQTARNRALRRQAASRSRSLTNLQDNPITQDSLLRLLSED